MGEKKLLKTEEEASLSQAAPGVGGHLVDAAAGRVVTELVMGDAAPDFRECVI